MNVIACVDIGNGMMFNKRRQSRDRVVIEQIVKYIGNAKLWMNSYSAELFKETSADIVVDDEFLDKAAEGDYCFVENCHINNCDVKQIILYRWDKKYPADFKLDIDLEGYTLKNTLEFKGYSHEKITREVYEK